MEEDTYWDRVRRIFHMMDVRMAFVSDGRLQEAMATLGRSERGEAVPEQELAAAKKVKDAVVHPDTGEKILLPLRLSFIIPANLVLDTLMLSASRHSTTILAQWANQTYNALHYRANRNATADEDIDNNNTHLLQAYLGATASAVAAAVGLNTLLGGEDTHHNNNKLLRAQAGASGEAHLAAIRAKARWAPIAKRFVPFAAVAAADVLNLGIMRREEYLKGINVYDATDRNLLLGQSRVAGAFAVSSCIAGRIAAAAPILVLPPLIMHRLERTWTFYRRPYLLTPTLMAMIGLSIQLFVPLTFGVFKQTAVVPTAWLEPTFHGMLDSQGRSVTHVVYNKGI
eukprot:jgi/Chlat1/523/Chrsp103S00997